MQNSNNRPLEERKMLLNKLYESWKSEYAWMLASYQLPQPRKAPSMANIDLSTKQMGQVPIEDLQKSVICGTILGDTSFGIQEAYRNPRMQNRHSTRQSSWFFWKWFICLQDFNNGLSSVTFQDPDGFQRKSQALPGEILGKLKINSKASSTLLQLHTVICFGERKRKRSGGLPLRFAEGLPLRGSAATATANNRKKIERKWLNHMNDYFLMTLWLDDGSLNNNRQGEIALDFFSLKEQKVFVDYLKAVWNIECFIYNTGELMRNGQIRHRIKIKDQENLLKLLRIVARIIPVKEMLYKVMFIPENNMDLLQRWASEVSELVYPEYKEYIVNKYNDIIQNYGRKEKKRTAVPVPVPVPFFIVFK